MASDLTNEFELVVESTYRVLRADLAVKHVARARLCQVSLDLTVVAFGVRSGYLFDGFAMRDWRISLLDFLSKFLTRLRTESPRFGTVVLVHDPTTDQIFFVSIPRLRTCMDVDMDNFSPSLATWVSFVKIHGSHVELSSPPPGLLAIIRMILADIAMQTDGGTYPVAVNLRDNADYRTISDMVAFAACVLEFPVAYVPTSEALNDGGALLGGIPLDVYECVLIPRSGLAVGVKPHPSSAGWGAHSLLKFSCPQSISTVVEHLHCDALVSRLRTRFVARMEDVTRSFEVVIRHSMETMDRVAL